MDRTMSGAFSRPITVTQKGSDSLTGFVTQRRQLSDLAKGELHT